MSRAPDPVPGIPLDRPIRMTKHARRRFKERTGLPMRAVDKAAAAALLDGLDPHQLPGFLRHKLVRGVANHAINRDDRMVVKVFRGFAFIFALRTQGDGDDALVLLTVLPGYDFTRAIDKMMVSAEQKAAKPRTPKSREEVFKYGRYRGGAK